LPPYTLGVFMRASLPSPRTSCSGTMLKLAGEQYATRMNPQWMLSFDWPI
jgi:hypothetical protein